MCANYLYKIGILKTIKLCIVIRIRLKYLKTYRHIKTNNFYLIEILDIIIIYSFRVFHISVS